MSVKIIRDAKISFRLPIELHNRLAVLAEYLYDSNMSDALNAILEREVGKYESADHV
jgi:predicted DNA-binding protein